MRITLKSDKEIKTIQLFVARIKEIVIEQLEESPTGSLENYSLQAEEQLIDELNRVLQKKLIDRRENATITILKATALLVIKYNHSVELPEWSANTLLQKTNSIYNQFINY